MKKVVHFLRAYWQCSVAILAFIVALILQLTKIYTAAHWVLGVVSILSIIPLLQGMYEDLRTGSYGIDILAITAIVTSVLLKQYWAAIIIVVMLTGGETLEDYAEHRAKTELDALLNKAPQKATVIRGRKTLEVAVRDVVIGDKVIIKPGEVVPVDAIILEGIADLDESALTGESTPQSKQKDDEILSGSLSIDGALTVRCIRVAQDSQYEQIIKLVRAASNSQAPFVRLADRYSIPFTIVSYGIAILAWISGHHAIRFLEVIVVATPCPLLLAAPIAIISGMSRAAKQGIIIKTGGALEQLAQTKSIAFDKTGTLTMGQLEVERVIAQKPFDRDTVLTAAASLEQQSNHVLAKAIVTAATARKLKLSNPKHLKEVSGRGLEATISSKHILVGRASFLRDHDIELSQKAAESTQTAVHVAIDGTFAGSITLKDTVRAESKKTISRLRKLNIGHILMVTGDHKSSATAVAKQVGIKVSDVVYEALPGDKLRTIEQLAERPVAFVGDGVNDAPVLTASDTGIALGARGSTAASESADVVIMLDDITYVASAFDIAKRTIRIAKQSITVGIIISVALMLFFATGHFAPLTGAILQEIVDVIVIFNALRALGANASI